MKHVSASPPPSAESVARRAASAGRPHPVVSLGYWQQFWPGFLAVALFLAIVGYGARRAILLNGGRLTYPIDDAYGHLAIAKNLLRHGIWGFSYLDGFSSGASSLDWPVLIMAAFAVFGVHDYIPFILNLVVASGLLIYASAVLLRYSVLGWLNFLVLALVVYLAAFPAVAASGMEHCLQTLLDVVFIDVAARVLAGELPLARRTARFGLPVLACLLVATRYEGLFIIAVVGFLFLCRGLWLPALIFGVASATVPTLFGLYSLHKGWYFLPNSLLLKGNTSPLSFTPAGLLLYFSKGYNQLLANPHVLFLTVALALALVVALLRHRTLWSAPVLLLVITLALTALHLQYAAFGWFYRYEAYLVILGLLSLSVCLADAMSPRLQPPPNATVSVPRPERFVFARLLPYGALLVAGVCLSLPLIRRADEAVRILPLACHNIYEQQFQMGMFLRRFYQSQGVVANDIGAIDYLADIRLFDIYGLGDIDVLRAKLAHAYDHHLVEESIKKHDARVIIVYDSWRGDYGCQLPEWVPVGQWVISNNVICGWHTVSFYAPDASLVPELTHALQAFAPSLPVGVGQFGTYRGQRPFQELIGAYDKETDGIDTFYWVGYAVKFFQYPLGDGPLGSAPVDSGQTQDAILHLSVRVAAPCSSIDVYVGDHLVNTRDFPEGRDSDWISWDVPTQVRSGLNPVRLVGHGEAVKPPRDGRKLLFATRPLRWTLPPVTSGLSKPAKISSP